MPALILHAGMPKTGTSTIQNTLSEELWDELLGAQKIHYLKHGRIAANHSRYFHSLLGKPEWTSTQVLDRNVASFTAALRAATASTPANNAVLISAESISPIAQNMEDLNRVRDFVVPYFSDVEVIAYVREPLSYMCSRIQQSLKNGHTLNHAVDNVVASADHTTWLRNLQGTFGSSNVAIRPYDPATLIDGEIVTDFCLGALGLPDSDLLRRRIDARTEHNYSLSSELMESLLSLYRQRSISPQNISGKFVRDISRRQWAGHKFDVGFFAERDRRRLMAAADKARAQLRDYLGYDCFPSYRPVDIEAQSRRSAPGGIGIFRQHIEQLQQALHDLGDTWEAEEAGRSGSKGLENVDEAKSETCRLLERFHDLCRKADG